MTNFLKRFAQDESGAVTVDWVVLTAGIVGLGVLVMNPLIQNIADVADDISEDMAGQINTGTGATYAE